MSQQNDHSGIDVMLQGDQEGARRLRATLAVIARRTDDPDLERTIRDVLAGRENVRRALLHPALFAMAERNFANLEEGLNRLSDDEREDLFSKVGEIRTPDEVIDALEDPPQDRPREPEPPAGPHSDGHSPRGGIW